MTKFRITYKYPQGPEYVVTEEIAGASNPGDVIDKLHDPIRFPYLFGQVTIIRIERLDS